MKFKGKITFFFKDWEVLVIYWCMLSIIMALRKNVNIFHPLFSIFCISVKCPF